MNSKLKLLSSLFAGLLLFSFTATAQIPDSLQTNETIEEKIEVLTEINESEVDFTEIAELLDLLRKNPINLNRATAADLKQLPFLSELQIVQLQNHIKQFGKLSTVYELQSIESFDMETINAILPYIYVDDALSKRKTTFSDIMDNGKHQYFTRYTRILQDTKGYSPITAEELAKSPNSRYLGSPDKLYMRYRMTYYNFLSVGVTAEKDQGEEFFKGSMKQGFDFYSAHLWMRDVGFLKTLAIGDYNLSFGQGTGLWTNLGFGKSSDIASMKKTARGITPYTSVDETKYMRGIAASYQLRDFELFGFYSHKRKDADLQQIDADSLDSEEYYISTLTETGYHRTPGELEKKNTLNETLYGGRLELKRFRFNAGTTLYNLNYEYPLSRKLQEYNKFEFNGKSLTIASLDYSYITSNMNFFGEVSRSDNGGIAFLQGAYLSVSKNTTLAFLYRNYQKNYQSIYTNAFAESSKASNEQGLYSGLDVRLHSKWTLNAYFDIFSFPWLKYQIDAPSRGDDMLFQLTYKHSKQAHFYVRYKQKTKFENSNLETLVNTISPIEKTNYRIHAHYAVSPSVVLKNRIELSELDFENKRTSGFLIYQDVTVNPQRYPWAISARYALFDGDTYDNAIYAYETDVLYGYSTPGLYEKGSRFYIVLRYSLNKHLDFWLRYAQTYYNNKTTIGSGMDEIQGNVKSEIKAQVRLRF